MELDCEFCTRRKLEFSEGDSSCQEAAPKLT